MPFALPVDPTPTSVEALLERLPAADRARLAWFPPQFRKEVVQPLRAVNQNEFAQFVDDIMLKAARCFYSLATVTAELLSDPAIEGIVLVETSTEVFQTFRERLAPRHQTAADNLQEAYAWLGAILAVLVDEYRAELPSVENIPSEPSECELRNELRGPAGTFLRGLVLTIAAAEVVLNDSELPPNIETWCEQALREVHATANTFRAEGIDVPTSVSFPGSTHRPRLPVRIRSGLLPTGVMELLISEFSPEEIWLYGSRARGTHSSTSDWDLLIVVPDDTPSKTQERFPQPLLRRYRVDGVLVRRSDFETGKSVPGSLSQIVLEEGYRVD